MYKIVLKQFIAFFWFLGIKYKRVFEKNKYMKLVPNGRYLRMLGVPLSSQCEFPFSFRVHF